MRLVDQRKVNGLLIIINWFSLAKLCVCLIFFIIIIYWRPFSIFSDFWIVVTNNSFLVPNCCFFFFPNHSLTMPRPDVNRWSSTEGGCSIVCRIISVASPTPQLLFSCFSSPNIGLSFRILKHKKEVSKSRILISLF